MQALVDHAAPAHIDHRRQRRHARDVVDDDAAGEILHAPRGEQTAAPHHVDEREVDEQQPGRQEYPVGLERHPVRKRAGDERGRDDREHHLVRAEDDERDRVVRRRGHRRGDAAEERPVEVSDDPAEVGPGLEIPAEAHRESAQPPQHRRPAHRHEALDHDREDVLASHEAAVEEREAWGHQHDQAGAQDHEPRVTGVEVKHRGLPSARRPSPASRATALSRLLRAPRTNSSRTAPGTGGDGIPHQRLAGGGAITRTCPARPPAAGVGARPSHARRRRRSRSPTARRGAGPRSEAPPAGPPRRTRTARRSPAAPRD